MAATGQIPFEPPVVTTLPNGANDVSLADLDEDGVLDVLTTPELGGLFGGTLRAITLPGVGDGTFGGPVAGLTMPTNLLYRGDVVDLDGDGHLDWALPDGNAPGQLLVFAGDDGLTFSAPSIHGSVSASFGSSDAIAVDLLGNDSHLDVLLFGYSGPFGPATSFSAFVADGLGGYTFVPGPALTGGGHAFAVGDINSDGFQDVVSTNPVVGQTISLYMGTSPTSWALTNSLSAEGGYPTHVRLVDVNGDGNLDLLLVDGFDGLMFLAGQGDGSFGPVQFSSVGDSAREIALGDLDGDNNLDAVVSTINEIHICKGAGDGTFAVVNTLAVPIAAGIDLGDMDGDGDLDIAVAMNLGLLFGPDSLGVLINRSYAPGSPFTDLGQGLAGSAGLPIQLAEGSLLPATPYSFDLFGAVPSQPVFLVLGATELGAPFKGGVLVPSPDVIVTLGADAEGQAAVAGNWPSGVASGVSVFVQWWFHDGGATAGLAASNGVRADIP